MGGTAKQVGQTAKSLAQQIAKQIAREPIEVLKTAGSQVTGEEVARPKETQAAPPATPEEQGKLIHQKEELQDKIKSGRRMEALNQELEDIHKQELFKDLQRRIAEGEEPPLEDFGELSPEQKQVLKAQIEAIKIRNEKFQNQGISEVPSVHSKPSRRFGAGQKQEAEKQQTRVEKPVPPSG